MNRLYRTGLQQYGHYGSDVTGVDQSELWQCQSEFLKWVGGRSTRSRTLSLLLLSDPSWRQGLGPALLWGSICWKAATARSSHRSRCGLACASPPKSTRQNMPGAHLRRGLGSFSNLSRQSSEHGKRHRILRSPSEPPGKTRETGATSRTLQHAAPLRGVGTAL